MLRGTGLTFPSEGTTMPLPAFPGTPRMSSRWLDSDGRNSYDVGMRSVVSEKGQVTIPKPLRDKLGSRPGQVLEFETRDGMLAGRKAAADENTGDAVGGSRNRISVAGAIAK